MNPHQSRYSSPKAGAHSRWSRNILAVAGVALGSLLAYPGTGKLDMSFTPLASELEGRSQFVVVGDACHGFDLLTPEIRRYGDDGRWDGTSRVVDDGRAGVTTAVHWVTATPWGGLWARGSVGQYAFDALGANRPLSGFGARTLEGMLPWIPLDDGGWVTPDLTRFSAEGVRDASFARACWLKSGSPTGYLSVLQVLRDPQGRLLAIGNFVKSGTETRLGIVRILPDGRPDPGFDPADALGISITEEGTLIGQPLSLALGKDGSIYVESTGGGPIRRLAQLDDGGRLIQWIDLNVSGFLLAPVIQPDGRILLGGIFDRWKDRPVPSLIRLLPDGTLDDSFQVELGHGPNQGSLMGMDLDARGRLWIRGWFDRVNGTERPGLARLLAYDPPGSPPEIRSTVSRTRIATHEVLYLAAEVSGNPPPELQWMREGQPIPGATNRVLQLPVDGDTSLGSFRLVAQNDSGVQELEFPRVNLGVRSPLAGQFDPDFDLPLGRLPDPQILMPLPDGRLWITAGGLASGAAEAPALGRLRADGSWDASFGTGGMVLGNGVVQAVLPLADGGVLLGGNFTRMAGAEARGLLELDARGTPVSRSWPELDVPEVTALARQPDGKLLIAGLFHRVGGRDAYHLARLDLQRQPDPEFRPALDPGQVVERLQLDSGGRIMVAGLRASADAPFPNFEPLGLQRLLSDGSRDPAFLAGANRWDEFVIRPGDSLLVGLPPRPLDPEGRAETAFDLADISVPGLSLIQSLGTRMLWLSNGEVMAPALRQSDSHMEVVRWHANGVLDDHFKLVLGPSAVSPPEIRSMASMPDGSVVLALMAFGAQDPDVAHRLRRLLPDPDTMFGNAHLVDGRLEATIATQPGATYEIYLHSRLDAGTGTRVDSFAGDGYLQTVSLPVTPGDEQQFLELVRRRRP